MTSKAFGLAQLGNAYADGALSNRNKIINGAMTIDQRNAGAAVTINNTGDIYGLDRFYGYGQETDGVFTIARSTVAPQGFVNSALITVTTADASIGASQFYGFAHKIEGYNISDLGWGTADAKTVTLSFWVRSSVTGTFGGAVRNGAVNRSYPFSYTISSANTWEQKSIIIAGDTTGTWATDNSLGFLLSWSIGDGSSRLSTAGAWSAGSFAGATGQTNLISTNGATFYITGVQLEAGDTATPFEHRSFGQELALCQRYYSEINVPDNVGQNGGNIGSGYQLYTSMFFPFKEKMRASPTVTQTFTLSTDDIGTVTHITSVDGYVLKHGFTAALYTYIEGVAKFNVEL